eukprot:COSAG01_NODE_1962_length_8790_cov_10.999540_7_plen_193_part_00
MEAARLARSSRLSQLVQQPHPEPVPDDHSVTVHSAALLEELGLVPPPSSGRLAPPAVRASQGGVKIHVDALVRIGCVLEGLCVHPNVAAQVQSAASGNTAVLELMIEGGAALDAKDAAGNTALIAAAMAEQRDCVEILLRAGADPNGANMSGEWTPLHAAAFKQAAAIAMVLLNHGADPEAPDAHGVRTGHV